MNENEINRLDDSLPDNLEVTESEVLALAPSMADDRNFEAQVIALLTNLLANTNWEGRLSRNQRLSQLPILANVPMRCYANGAASGINGKEIPPCPYHDVCPIMEMCTEEEKTKLIGTRCRIDMIEIVRMFSDLVRGFEIDPDNSVEVYQVTTLVRLYIQRRRGDWEINKGMMMDNPTFLNQRTNDIHFAPITHPILDQVEKIQKQIDRITSQLMGSRSDKAAAQKNSPQGGGDFMSMIAGAGGSEKILKALEERGLTVDPEEISSLPEESDSKTEE